MKKPFFQISKISAPKEQVTWVLSTWDGMNLWLFNDEQEAIMLLKALRKSLDLWVNGETGEGIPCHE